MEVLHLFLGDKDKLLVVVVKLKCGLPSYSRWNAPTHYMMEHFNFMLLHMNGIQYV